MDSAFCMIPPDYSQPDQVEYYSRLASVYAEAIRSSAVTARICRQEPVLFPDRTGRKKFSTAYQTFNLLCSVRPIFITTFSTSFWSLYNARKPDHLKIMEMLIASGAEINDLQMYIDEMRGKNK